MRQAALEAERQQKALEAARAQRSDHDLAALALAKGREHFDEVEDNDARGA